MAATFDTLKYAEALKNGGIPEPQAKAQAAALADVLKEWRGELATRQDIKDLAAATQQDIKDLKQDLKNLEASTKQDLKDLEHRLTIRVGKMIARSTGITIAVLGGLLTLL